MATPFVMQTICEGDDKQTWLTLLDAVLKARIEQDLGEVTPVIWEAFLLFAFKLVQ